MSCQLHPQIRGQQTSQKKATHSKCPSVKSLAKGLEASHLNRDFPKISNLDKQKPMLFHKSQLLPNFGNLSQNILGMLMHGDLKDFWM